MYEQAVKRLLVSVGAEPDGRPVRVAGGWSATSIWRVSLDGRPLVLRVFAPGEGSDADLEAVALTWGRERGLPVPAVVARNTVDGRSFLLLEWVEGRPLHEFVLAEAGHARGYGEQFGRMQARLHGESGPPDLPDALDWPAREACPADLRARLEELAADACLLHLDFHPANVLVDGGQIAGLIDWTNARCGDPRFDVARTHLLLRMMPRLVAVTAPELTDAVRAATPVFFEGWWDAYREAAGEPRDLAPFLAWAGYGMTFDLGRKPLDDMPAEARRGMDELFVCLRRETDTSMMEAGLK